MSKSGMVIFLLLFVSIIGAGFVFYKKEVSVIRHQLAQQQQEIELAQTNNIMLEQKLQMKGIIDIDKKKFKNIMSMRHANKMSLKKLKELMDDDIKNFNDTEDN